MEYKLRVLPAEELMEPLMALMEETESVPLVISGSSMTPFLAPGRDTVYLSRVDRPLKRGDMVLYRRDNGSYILHRIYRVEPESFTMVGDAQTRLEPGIRRDQILAVVTALRRKGKLLRGGSFWWVFFEKVWIRMVPLRPGVRSLYTHITKILGKDDPSPNRTGE